MNMRVNYKVDEEAIKDYFPLHVVTAGMLQVYEELLSLKFNKVSAPAVKPWHEDVELFAVSDATTGEFMGHFWLDLFPRYRLSSERAGELAFDEIVVIVNLHWLLAIEIIPQEMESMAMLLCSHCNLASSKRMVRFKYVVTNSKQPDELAWLTAALSSDMCCTCLVRVCADSALLRRW